MLTVVLSDLQLSNTNEILSADRLTIIATFPVLLWMRKLTFDDSQLKRLCEEVEIDFSATSSDTPSVKSSLRGLSEFCAEYGVSGQAFLRDGMNPSIREIALPAGLLNDHSLQLPNKHLSIHAHIPLSNSSANVVEVQMRPNRLGQWRLLNTAHVRCEPWLLIETEGLSQAFTDAPFDSNNAAVRSILIELIYSPDDGLRFERAVRMLELKPDDPLIGKLRATGQLGRRLHLESQAALLSLLSSITDIGFAADDAYPAWIHDANVIEKLQAGDDVLGL